MSDDYYYSGQYAEEQAEAEAQAKEAAHRQGPWHVSEHTDGRDAPLTPSDHTACIGFRRWQKRVRGFRKPRLVEDNHE